MNEGYFDFSDVKKPENVNEVIELILNARDRKTPVIVRSSSGNHRRGLSSPLVKNSTLVDLSSMNRILSINRTFLMTTVEAGVTYGQLSEELKKHGMMISMPIAPRSDKSVVADVLEPSPRFNPMYQWNHMDPLRCTEVVWGDGNHMFTGEAGGGALDLAKQQAQGKWQINGTGPMMLDFYRLLTGSVGTMGIVTWVSLKCEPLSPIRQMRVAADDDIIKLIDLAYRMTHKRLGVQLAIVNKQCFAALMGKKNLESNIPEYILLSGIESGEILPELKIKQQKTDIAFEANSAGLEMLDNIAGFSGNEILDATCSPRNYDWHTIRSGRSEDLYFVTTLDRSPAFIRAFKKEAEITGYDPEDLQFYLQPLHQGSSIQFEALIPFTTHNSEKVKQLRSRLVKKASELNGYFARPYKTEETLIELAKNPGAAKLLSEIKDIFDPDHILNPGRLSTAAIIEEA